MRFWIKRYNQEGPPGLYDEPRSGRPRKAGEAVQDTLEELLQDDPQREGYLATFWTVAMLVVVLAQKLQVVLSAQHPAQSIASTELALAAAHWLAAQEFRRR